MDAVSTPSWCCTVFTYLRCNKSGRSASGRDTQPQQLLTTNLRSRNLLDFGSDRMCIVALIEKPRLLFITTKYSTPKYMSTIQAIHYLIRSLHSSLGPKDIQHWCPTIIAQILPEYLPVIMNISMARNRHSMSPFTGTSTESYRDMRWLPNKHCAFSRTIPTVLTQCAHHL
jgi:hypothetical protein